MNHCLIYDLLWRDYTLKGKAPDDLPLTRYSGTPYGCMIARTGWEAKNIGVGIVSNAGRFCG